jgi:hypothetical protein
VEGDGTVLDSITYDTFGNIISETAPSSGDRFKFTSREWDSEIGQYFYRARYYGKKKGSGVFSQLTMDTDCRRQPKSEGAEEV